MTDNEIIKALECCDGTLAGCAECPNYKNRFCCTIEKDALDLIKSQKAEIERLEAMIDAAEEHFAPLPFKNKFDEYIEKAKAEAIEDVLLTLEAEAASSDKYISEYDDSEVQKAANQALWHAYNLVKEMVGEHHDKS